MRYKNELILDVFKDKNIERPPVWVMRQAGRILPGYRKIRASVGGFKELVQNPRLIAEVTVEPLEILGVDAAILFSDILVIPEAMGLDYDIVESRGPVFSTKISNREDIDQLSGGVLASKRLDYVYESIELTKRRIDHRVPLIGFSGAPWTLFAYMVEGSGSKTFSKAKRFLYQHPEDAHELMDKITTTIISYLHEKMRCGIDVIQLFDSWADQLSPDQYKEFSIPYIRRICEAIKGVPVILFPKGAWSVFQNLETIPFDALGLDWKTPPAFAREILGRDLVIQGNMDPCQLYASEDEIIRKTQEMLKSFGRKHIVNLGHGVYPDTDADKVKLFIDTVKRFRYNEL